MAWAKGRHSKRTSKNSVPTAALGEPCVRESSRHAQVCGYFSILRWWERAQLPGTIHVHLLTESYSQQVNVTEEGR